MKPVRVLILIGALAAAFGAQSIVGRGQQGSAPASAVTGNSPFESLHFRPIGPASMSGRITDLAVYESNPSIFYVGTAHGGVWKTTNAGTTFEAQFQDQGLISIGDITVSQNNPDLVWVGSGESNNRQSTSWGDGVYKSTDGGKTWMNMGLKTSRFINRIVIDPRNNDIVLVAATGSLFGPGGERGIYKTTDGGKTWKQTLKVDDDTGANDLVMDSTDNKILYASMYQRRRTACCMNGGGPGSGMWKSTDGGDTWTKLTKGLPERADGPHRPRRESPPAERAVRDRRRSVAAAGGTRRRGHAESGRSAAGRRPRRDDRGRRRRHADRPLPLRRRRRDLAQGEQRERAADVLQPGADRSERSGDGALRAASSCTRRSTAARRSRSTRRRRFTTTCTRSGSIRRTRTT